MYFFDYYETYQVCLYILLFLLKLNNCDKNYVLPESSLSDDGSDDSEDSTDSTSNQNKPNKKKINK